MCCAPSSCAGLCIQGLGMNPNSTKPEPMEHIPIKLVDHS